jgi:hypothetical protein
LKGFTLSSSVYARLLEEKIADAELEHRQLGLQEAKEGTLARRNLAPKQKPSAKQKVTHSAKSNAL